MDHIDEMLTNHSLNLDYELSIRAALGIAKKTLNRYYNATDHSEVYHIAMVTKSFSFRMVITTNIIMLSIDSVTSPTQT
jgi:hypothetical protein